MKKQTRVKIEQEDIAIVEKSVLAQNILEISKAVQKLQRGGLNLKAIEVLVWSNCGIPSGHTSKPGIGEVRAVIQSIRTLEQEYCK